MVELYSSKKCKLGESPVWVRGRNSFVWLDILNRTMYEKTMEQSNQSYSFSQVFDFTPTVILLDKHSEESVYIIADNGIHHFNLTTSLQKHIVNFQLARTHRTNDGAVSPDGTIYFGTMQWDPEDETGLLYSVNNRAILQGLSINIGIPNTFVWIDHQHVAISDSFKQRVDLYRSEKCDLHYTGILYDFSEYGGEPDGGALDTNGMLWLSLWGMGRVVCLDPRTKKIVDHIDVPVERPSNCCFGGTKMDQLFITSAPSDQKHDEGGSSFLVEMKVCGTEVDGFSLCQ